MSKKVFCLVLLTGFYSILFSQNKQRYVDSMFTAEQTYSNLTYATTDELNNPYVNESTTHKVSLKMHIFEPKGDTLTKRPILICAHGGGFVSGNKEHDDMIEFCKQLAGRGYITATMQYRLGMNTQSSASAERAVYRGLQDGRAAIRFIRSKASQLKIDPDNVFFLGSSAGAFIGLQNLYMNDVNERPLSSYKVNNTPPNSDDGPDLGDYDAVEPQLTGNAHPKALIPLWGAIKHTDLIKSSDVGIQVLLIHGTADQIVPFDIGKPFNAPGFPPTYGSNQISQRLNQLSGTHQTYFVQGEGHEFYGVVNGKWSPAPNQYWNIVLKKVIDFLYEQHKPKANFTYQTQNNQVAFQDASENAERWEWDFGDGATSKEKNPVHTFLPSFYYNVSLTVYNKISSWDKKNITIDLRGLDTNVETVPSEFYLSQNYPNPFNPSTKINYQIPVGSHVTLIVYDLLGRTVSKLIDDYQPPGVYWVEFSKEMINEKITSGIYFYAISNGNRSITKKMVLVQ